MIISTTKKHNRLVFIDALRSFAIIMMLQGHFISTLLNDSFKDRSNDLYVLWEYFRGITAPTFFTITGFIFMFLLLKQKETGWDNLRVKKGLKRGLNLIIWGYVLRIGISGMLAGYVHDAYFYTDVLHIIGLSLILLCLIYLALYRYGYRIFNIALFSITFIIFLYERYYNAMSIPYLPEFLSHYLTKANGAVFSIFPWFGYVSIGAFLASLFLKFQTSENFYDKMPLTLGLTGLFLMFFSTPLLLTLGDITGVSAFTVSGDYNYLFTRLGDVFILFTVFVYLRKWLNHSMFIKIGAVTLSIYIVHHIILYGSWFHTGLSRWFYNSLTFTEAFFGAVAFVAVVCFLVLRYRNLVNETAKNLQAIIYRQFRILRVAYSRASR